MNAYLGLIHSIYHFLIFRSFLLVEQKSGKGRIVQAISKMENECINDKARF